MSDTALASDGFPDALRDAPPRKRSARCSPSAAGRRCAPSAWSSSCCRCWSLGLVPDHDRRHQHRADARSLDDHLGRQRPAGAAGDRAGGDRGDAADPVALPRAGRLRAAMRMVAMFAVAAAVPAVIVAVVATISLNQGLDQWFSERTKTMVESSRLVARSYMLEHAQVLRDDIIWVAGELEQARGDLRDRPRPVPAHPDRAGGHPLAAVRVAGLRRWRHADAGADQRAGRAAASCPTG